MITNDNKIKEYEYINNKDENNRGVLHLKSEDEEFDIKYYDYSVHFSNETDKIMKLNEISDSKAEDIKKEGINYILSCREIMLKEGYIFANIVYYSPLKCENKINDRVSHFFSSQMYGNTFFTLSEPINSGNMVIDMTQKIYESMESNKILSDSTTFKIKNIYYCNPIRELNIM